MAKNNVHSADGSFLGFLFQIERVMLWLSEGGERKIVGIETDDDIVVQIQSGVDIDIIYEQAKNAQGGNIPFSDQSEDLWKTLSIWVKAVEEDRININNAIFSAITNKKLPASRLLLKLSKAKKENNAEMLKVIKELKGTALKLSKDNKKYGSVITNCEEQTLINIVDKIVVLDGSFHHDHNAFKKQLKANLSIGDKLPFDHIYNGLFGSVISKIINCWRNREEAWINVESFNNLYNELVAEFLKKSFVEQATSFIPVKKSEIEQNRKSLYVEQLNSINCNEQEILEAIHDYLRCQSEKSRYAKEFEVPESKFLEYYDDLTQHWKNISRPRFRINPQGLSPEDIGYQVYNETTLYKGKLNNQEPKQGYTYKGAYHYLANMPEIGWHPTWETKFKKTNNASKDK
ncbi:MAG: hypothetical protein IT271_12720 [Chitinophagales bacterium]|nr:hypothetical protein [Chitinophagales bacterium]